MEESNVQPVNSPVTVKPPPLLPNTPRRHSTLMITRFQASPDTKATRWEISTPAD